MSQAGVASITKAVPSIPTSFVTDSGTAIPVANILEIFGGPGVTVTGVGNIVTINVATSGFNWNIVTSASNPITFTPENGYITKGAGSVHFILPPAASVGDTYRIVGYGNLWTIAQNANQSINLGIVSTSVGVGGSIIATGIKDSIELVCVTTNLEWEIVDVTGNPSFV